MTTTVTVQCSNCQASYQAPKEREGARFKCRHCGATLVVPRSEPERPVVMPATPPPAAAQRPVVMPASPPPAEQRPVVMPAAAAATEVPERPVIAPSRSASAPASRARPHTRPERPAREPDAAAEAPRRSRLNLVLLVIGGVALLAIGGYLAWPKSTDPD